MIFRFLNFALDTERRELSVANKPVSLPPKAFDVLCYLINNRSRMVTKSELLDAFWSAQASEAALQKNISLIRKALAETDKTSIALKTYHGLGFRFPLGKLQSLRGTRLGMRCCYLPFSRRRLASTSNPIAPPVIYLREALFVRSTDI